jgi:hypothetical protein
MVLQESFGWTGKFFSSGVNDWKEKLQEMSGN